MAVGQAEKFVPNVPVRAAWDSMAADDHAQLIDVRSAAEWNIVGIPDLSTIGRQAILVEWQTYPSNRSNPQFVAQCQDELMARNADHTTPIYFLCRSGSRSRSAALALQAAGYPLCYNVAEGFEGPLDARHHRSVSGWKVEGLPWMQG